MSELVQMRVEQAAEFVTQNLKQIKIILKSKVETYSLKFKPTFRKFIKKLKANDYEIVRKIPGNGVPASYLSGLLKDFLIEEAYFAQDAQDYFQKIVSSWLNKKNIDPGLFLDIDSFVKEKMEENGFQRIKKFKEGSKFSTFLYMVVKNLAIEYLRQQGKVKIVSKKFENEIVENLCGKILGPEESSIGEEEEKIKEKIAAILPQKVEALEDKEKFAFQLYYYKNITNISRIARDMNTTRHEAEQMIKGAWDKILFEVKNEISEVFSKSKKNSSNKDGGQKSSKRRSP